MGRAIDTEISSSIDCQARQVKIAPAMCRGYYGGTLNEI